MRGEGPSAQSSKTWIFLPFCALCETKKYKKRGTKMQTKKMRLVSVFLALAMMLLLVPVGAFAEGNSMSGSCGDNVSWVLTQNNTGTSKPTYTLTITGTGAMADESYNAQPWNWARERITKIEIDEGVTAIGAYSFYGCHSLVDVKIPDSVTSIGTYAFRMCYGLTSVTLPDSVTSIGAHAFDSCYGLASVTLPDRVTSIGKGVFEDCYGLTSVTLPDGLKKIDYQAFAYCYALQSITLPQSVESLDGSTFYACHSLRDVTLNAKTAGDYTFNTCYTLKHATVSNRVESLGEGTFFHCYTLRRVDFEPGSKLEANGANTFGDCYAGLKVYCEPSLKAKGLLSNRGVADENIITSVEVTLVDGEHTEQKTVDYGTLAGTLLDTLGEPTRENSTFLGWYTADGQKLEPDQRLTDDMTLTARWNNSYRLSFSEDCTAEVEDSPVQSGAYVQAGKKVTLNLTNEAQKFESYGFAPVTPEDLTVQDSTATFTMPESDVEVTVQWAAEDSSDEGWDAATVAAGVAVGAGTAVLAYHIGTEVYAEQVLGKGVIVPTLRGEVARKAWELAGKPAVAVEGTDEPSESAQVEQWVVESGLMKVRKDGAFHPEQTMTKLKALRVLDNAKKQNAQ